MVTSSKTPTESNVYIHASTKYLSCTIVYVWDVFGWIPCQPKYSSQVMYVPVPN